jgi:hypothetical protein
LYKCNVKKESYVTIEKHVTANSQADGSATSYNKSIMHPVVTKTSFNSRCYLHCQLKYNVNRSVDNTGLKYIHVLMEGKHIVLQYSTQKTKNPFVTVI